MQKPEMNRRGFITAGAGAMALTAIAKAASAAELTLEEQSNVQVVNEVCAAWPSHDLDNIMGFFADD